MTLEETLDYEKHVQIVNATGGFFMFYSPGDDEEWKYSEELAFMGEQSTSFYIDFCKNNNLTMCYFVLEKNPVINERLVYTYGQQIIDEGVMCPLEIADKIQDFFLSMSKYGLIPKSGDER